jgi:hypothetical protein
MTGIGEGYDSGKTQVPGESIRHFLEAVQKAQGQSHPSLGLGENVRFEDHSVSGASLIHEERVLHLSAFRHIGKKNYNYPAPGRKVRQGKTSNKENY